MAAPLETIRATPRKIVWRSNENNFAMTSAELVDGEVSEPITLKGDVPSDGFVLNLTYQFYGQWEAPNPRYGKQFRFRQAIKTEQFTREGIIAYLTRYTNLTHFQSSKLFERFRQDTVRMLRERPLDCLVTPRLTEDRVKEASFVLRNMQRTEAARIELAELLNGRGFPQTLIDACISQWGIMAPQVVRKDPFKMMVAGLPGCGFNRCDKFYLDLGLSPDRLRRQMFCLWHGLQDNNDGHTWFPIEYAETVLRKQMSGVGDHGLKLRDALRLAVRAKWIRTHRDVNNRLWIAVSEKAASEARVVSKLALLATGRNLWPKAEELQGVSDSQRTEYAKATAGPVGILEGVPGTGKSYVSVAAIRALLKKRPGQVCVLTPTGKAAVRLNSSLVRDGIGCTAGTIHRTLVPQKNGHEGKGWGFVHNEHNPLPYLYYVVDEASMLDTTIAADMLAAFPKGSHVLFVGDPNQLPPVSHGAPFRDVIAAGIPRGCLTEIKRNSGDITEVCHAIRHGQTWRPSNGVKLSEGRNVMHVPATNPSIIIDSIKRLVKDIAGVHLEPGKPLNMIWDLQVLCAINSKSEISRSRINDIVQELVNPNGARHPSHRFRVGDKVICTTNSSLPLVDDDGDVIMDDRFEKPEPVKDFVANGEIGEVTSVGDKKFIVRFQAPDRSVLVKVGKAKETPPPTGSSTGGETAEGDESSGSGCDFDLAYAVSFHKSQGSQWPVVFLVVDGSNSARRIGCRELWYTGISRAELLDVIIGPVDEIHRQCQRVSLVARKTFLKERLQKALEGEGS